MSHKITGVTKTHMSLMIVTVTACFGGFCACAAVILSTPFSFCLILFMAVSLFLIVLYCKNGK